MKISIDIPIEYIRSAIRSGRDSGISYWCKRVRDDSDDGSWLGFHVREDVDEGGYFRMGQEELERGLQLMAMGAPRTFAQLLADKSDANTGDLLIQYACFGEIRYA